MVLGIGGVGAAAVMGAALAGAERIVAVDVNADKLALAPGFGATDVVEAGAAGGMVVQVGGTSHGMESIPISPNLLLAQRSIVGTTFGGPDPARDVVRWIDLHRAGRLPLEKLITQR